MNPEVSYENMKALEEENENLRDQVAALKDWKDSTTDLLNSIDLQTVGKELGVPLGQEIGPMILPGIRDLKAQIEASSERKPEPQSSCICDHMEWSNPFDIPTICAKFEPRHDYPHICACCEHELDCHNHFQEKH